MLIHSKSHPRAGLVGNPSDGYFGKTISFIVRNFEAEVVLYETPELKKATISVLLANFDVNQITERNKNKTFNLIFTAKFHLLYLLLLSTLSIVVNFIL